jgi:hypothetical protein
MRYFKRALVLAPSLLSMRSFWAVSTAVVMMTPSKSNCAQALPSGKKDDKGEDNIFKIFTDKIPAHVKDDFQDILTNGAGSLKTVFESGVPAQVLFRELSSILKKS